MALSNEDLLANNPHNRLQFCDENKELYTNNIYHLHTVPNVIL